MERLKKMKETLMCAVESEINGDLKHVDTKELGEAIDMIKDLEEAMYYCSIVKAMEENKDLNRIKVMLAEKKRTNKWLAEQLGVNAATVSKWCTNSSQPSLDMLSKIAEALEVDYTELVRIKRIHGEEE